MNNLIVNGIDLGAVVSGRIPAPWMDGVSMVPGMGPKIGGGGLLNFGQIDPFGVETPRYAPPPAIRRGAQQIVVKASDWPIGGVSFDGIMGTEHNLASTSTNYPIQSGAVMSDHVIQQPTSLSIQVMVSDANPFTTPADQSKLDSIANKMKSYRNMSNYAEMERDLQSGSRSRALFSILECMKVSGELVEVVTRLKTYKNMLLVNISVADDLTTLYGLKASLFFEEKIIADTPSVFDSKRSQANAPDSYGGIQDPPLPNPVEGSLIDSLLPADAKDKIRETFGEVADYVNKGLERLIK